MTVATNHQQHRTAQCRGGQGPVAASRTAHSPAAFNKHQDRSAFRGRAGFFVRRTLLHGSSSQVTEPGLRARPFSHVGWCFNTARDFLDFQTLQAAYEAECGRQEARLRHELELVKALPRTSDREALIAEAEAAIAAQARREGRA